MLDGPAYRLETERLVLRCWSPERDSVLVRASLDRSDRHLRPFIPFMSQEPRSLEETAVWLRGHRAAFDGGRHFRYAMFDRAETQLIGEAMLLDRHGRGEREVGYWIDVEHVGRGYATEAAGALTRVALEIDRVDRVELQCVPENEASAAIAKKLGYRHEATLRRRAIGTDGVVRDLMIWNLFQDDYPESPARRIALRAYSCLGTQLL